MDDLDDTAAAPNSELTSQIQDCKRQGMHKKILRLVQEATEKQELNQITASYAVKSLLRMGKAEVALEVVPLWQEALRRDAARETPIDTLAAAALVKSLCRAGCMESALTVVEELGLGAPNAATNDDADAVREYTPVQSELLTLVLPEVTLGFFSARKSKDALRCLDLIVARNITIDDEMGTKYLRLLIGTQQFTSLARFMSLRKALKLSSSTESLQVIASRFAANIDFITGAVSMDKLPVPKYPEVAFIGRSNVGKSSLVNTLLCRKNLAFTSKTPGKTTEFNYFLARPPSPKPRGEEISAAKGKINVSAKVSKSSNSDSKKLRPSKADTNNIKHDIQPAGQTAHTPHPGTPFYAVDLPGVGYAKVSKSQRMDWLNLLKDYIHNRPNLRLVCHLMDSRLGAMGADFDLLEMLHDLPEHVQLVVVLTKADKKGEVPLPQVVSELETALRQHIPAGRNVPIVLSSSRSRTGSMELWQLLIEHLLTKPLHSS